MSKFQKDMYGDWVRCKCGKKVTRENIFFFECTCDACLYAEFLKKDARP